MPRFRSLAARATALAGAGLLVGGSVAMAAGGSGPNGHPAAEGLVAAPLAVPAQSPGIDLEFHTLAPCRIVDTRAAGGTIAAQSSRTFKTVSGLSSQGGNGAGCGVPTSAVAIQANLVAVPTGSAGYFTSYAAGTTKPSASTMNYGKSDAIANGATIQLSSADQFTLFSNKKAHAVVDVVGFYTKPLYAAVTSSGAVYNGTTSGLVSVTRTGNGAYTLVFDRAVDKCSWSGTDLVFSGTRDVSIDPGYAGSNDTVTVRVTNASNTLEDTYFMVSGTC